MSTKEINSFNIDEYDLGKLIGSEKEKEEIRELVCDYACKINLPSQNDVEVIIEQYLILKARKIDAYNWISSIITEVGKKDESKKYIGYIIGIIRNRMTYGWGTTRSDEEILVIKAIENIVGRELSLESKATIYKLMGDYGGTKIAFALNKVSIENLFLESLEKELKDQENSVEV